MVYNRIKALREQKGITQAELGKNLGISRSAVNSWEAGISVPSTQYIVALSHLFSVSTDYILLGTTINSTISIDGLTESDVTIVSGLIHHLKEKNQK